MIKHEPIRFRDYSRISVDCKNPKATQLIVKGEKHERLVAWTAIMIRNICDLISALANNTSTTLKLIESIRDKSINWAMNCEKRPVGWRVYGCQLYGYLMIWYGFGSNSQDYFVVFREWLNEFTSITYNYYYYKLWPARNCPSLAALYERKFAPR